PAGITATQVSELERRLITLEKRPATASARNSPLQIATVEPTVPPPMPSGLRRNANGCFYLTPDVDVVTGTFATNDKFCTVDGQPSWSIARIVDDRFYYGPPGSEGNTCYIGPNTNPCYLSFFNQRLTMKGKTLTLDSSGKSHVEIEFRRTN